MEAEEEVLAESKTQAVIQVAEDFEIASMEAKHVRVKAASLQGLKVQKGHVYFSTLAEQEGLPIQHDGICNLEDLKDGGNVFVRCSNVFETSITLHEGDVVGFIEVPEIGPNHVEVKADNGFELPAWDHDDDPSNPALEAAANKLFAMINGSEVKEPSHAPPDRPPNTAKKKDRPLGRGVVVDEPTTWQEEMVVSGVGAAEASRYIDIPINFSKAPITAEQQERFRKMLQQRHRTFSSDPDKPGFCDLVRLHLDTGSEQPVRMKPYRLSKVEDGVVDDQISKWLENEVIEPSNSEWAFPVVVVRRLDANGKTTKWRVTVDYRRLNKILRNKEMAYPLTLIDSCLDSMHGSMFFSVSDLQQAYHQVAVDREDGSVEKTAFVTSKGQWQFLRCPFGIKSLPSLWLRLADMVFQGLKWQVVNLYMDDLCIFSKDFDQHLKDVNTVLKRVEDAGLTINPKKSKWCQEEVEFLGFIVGNKGVRANSEKVKAKQRPS